MRSGCRVGQRRPRVGALAGEGLRWGAGVLLLARLRGLHEGGSEGGAPAGVAVVIPARNEAASLPRLLACLRAQTAPPDEVVVVDDGSEDATASLARASGARVVSAGPVPQGWTGKTWACELGVAATTAPLLVLLDADVELAPDALRRLVADYGRRGSGLLSAVPEQVAARPHQRLSALCQLVAIMGTGSFSAFPRWMEVPAAFGPCLVCRRGDYQAVGGHRSVGAAMAEDLALARSFAAAGLPVRVRLGKPLVRCSSYPDGARQLVDGWARTLAAGARATRPLTLLLVVAWVSGLIAAAGGGRVGRGPGGLIRYLAYAAQLEWMLGQVGDLGRGTGMLFPLPLAAFLAAFTRSWAARAGWGNLDWKDRRLSLGGPVA